MGLAMKFYFDGLWRRHWFEWRMILPLWGLILLMGLTRSGYPAYRVDYAAVVIMLVNIALYQTRQMMTLRGTMRLVQYASLALCVFRDSEPPHPWGGSLS